MLGQYLRDDLNVFSTVLKALAVFLTAVAGAYVCFRRKKQEILPVEVRPEVQDGDFIIKSLEITCEFELLPQEIWIIQRRSYTVQALRTGVKNFPDRFRWWRKPLPKNEEEWRKIITTTADGELTSFQPQQHDVFSFDTCFYRVFTKNETRSWVTTLRFKYVKGKSRPETSRLIEQEKIEKLTFYLKVPANWDIKSVTWFESPNPESMTNAKTGTIHIKDCLGIYPVKLLKPNTFLKSNNRYGLSWGLAERL